MAMEPAGLTRPDDDRCVHLRWKGMFIDTVWDPTVPHSNDRAYWCQHTQNCLGPDNQLVDEYECHDGRTCYKPL
ncbi:MAG: hypothetical protein HYS04_05775 [Acidobacteria bacterium]|nr:hypothetical protein [Acidobacteriota bacterium]